MRHAFAIESESYDKWETAFVGEASFNLPRSNYAFYTLYESWKIQIIITSLVLSIEEKGDGDSDRRYAAELTVNLL